MVLFLKGFNPLDSIVESTFENFCPIYQDASENFDGFGSQYCTFFYWVCLGYSRSLDMIENSFFVFMRPRWIYYLSRVHEVFPSDRILDASDPAHEA